MPTYTRLTDNLLEVKEEKTTVLHKDKLLSMKKDCETELADITLKLGLFETYKLEKE